jgi:hypothetical protein
MAVRAAGGIAFDDAGGIAYDDAGDIAYDAAGGIAYDEAGGIGEFWSLWSRGRVGCPDGPEGCLYEAAGCWKWANGTRAFP